MIDVTDKTFEKEVLQSSIPVIVDFYANWCGPCQMLGPVLEELSTQSEYVGKLKFARVNTEDFPTLAEENSVQGIPCMIFFKSGKEVNRIVGFAPKPVMKSKIDEALVSIA